MQPVSGAGRGPPSVALAAFADRHRIAALVNAGPILQSTSSSVTAAAAAMAMAGSTSRPSSSSLPLPLTTRQPSQTSLMTTAPVLVGTTIPVAAQPPSHSQHQLLQQSVIASGNMITSSGLATHRIIGPPVPIVAGVVGIGPPPSPPPPSSSSTSIPLSTTPIPSVPTTTTNVETGVVTSPPSVVSFAATTGQSSPSSSSSTIVTLGAPPSSTKVSKSSSVGSRRHWRTRSSPRAPIPNGAIDTGGRATPPTPGGVTVLGPPRPSSGHVRTGSNSGSLTPNSNGMIISTPQRRPGHSHTLSDSAPVVRSSTPAAATTSLRAIPFTVPMSPPTLPMPSPTPPLPSPTPPQQIAIVSTTDVSVAMPPSSSMSSLNGHSNGNGNSSIGERSSSVTPTPIPPLPPPPPPPAVSPHTMTSSISTSSPIRTITPPLIAPPPSSAASSTPAQPLSPVGGRPPVVTTLTRSAPTSRASTPSTSVATTPTTTTAPPSPYFPSLSLNLSVPPIIRLTSADLPSSGENDPLLLSVATSAPTPSHISTTMTTSPGNGLPSVLSLPSPNPPLTSSHSGSSVSSPAVTPPSSGRSTPVPTMDALVGLRTRTQRLAAGLSNDSWRTQPPHCQGSCCNGAITAMGMLTFSSTTPTTNMNNTPIPSLIATTSPSNKMETKSITNHSVNSMTAGVSGASIPPPSPQLINEVNKTSSWLPLMEGTTWSPTQRQVCTVRAL
jgi:hypothetical protein